MDTFKDLLAQKDQTISWLEDREKGASLAGKTLFYASADLRKSPFKAAPVDLNIFPAGFNNLCHGSYGLAARLVGKYAAGKSGEIKNVLLVPESHFGNLHYLCHLAALVEILRKAGLSPAVGFPSDQAENLKEHEAACQSLPLCPIERKGASLVDKSGRPFDLVILNNDLSGGLPDYLVGLSQPVEPSPQYGWYRRSKSRHCQCYSALAQSFAKDLKLDSWAFVPAFEKVSGVDMESSESREKVAEAASRILDATKRAYAERGIGETPRVFVKNDAGTYGMGILTASSPEEIVRLNHHGREKMAKGKDRRPITDLLVQEAIPTMVHVNGMPAEIVSYMLGGAVCGLFSRINGGRDDFGNLNSPGMAFKAICSQDKDSGPSEDDLFLYETMSRLACLAAEEEL